VLEQQRLRAKGELLFPNREGEPASPLPGGRRVVAVDDVPIVHSTVNVATGRGRPTLAPFAELHEDERTVLDDLLVAWVRR